MPRLNASMFTDEQLDELYVWTPGGLFSPAKFERVGAPKITGIFGTVKKVEDQEFKSGMFDQMFSSSNYGPKGVPLRELLKGNQHTPIAL